MKYILLLAIIATLFIVKCENAENVNFENNLDYSECYRCSKTDSVLGGYFGNTLTIDVMELEENDSISYNSEGIDGSWDATYLDSQIKYRNFNTDSFYYYINLEGSEYKLILN